MVRNHRRKNLKSTRREMVQRLKNKLGKRVKKVLYWTQRWKVERVYRKDLMRYKLKLKINARSKITILLIKLSLAKLLEKDLLNFLHQCLNHWELEASLFRLISSNKLHQKMKFLKLHNVNFNRIKVKFWLYLSI